MEPSNEDRQLLQRLEEELWREDTRFDMDRMNELLAPHFFEFGRSGRVYQRKGTLAIGRQTIDAVLPLTEFRVRLLSENIAQVTYNSAVKYGGVPSMRAEALSGLALLEAGCYGSSRNAI